MFVMPIHNPEKPYVQMIDEDIELAVKCDELGFDDFGLENPFLNLRKRRISEIFWVKFWG